MILVTGGGRRIGAAISRLLMESGYYVLIHVNRSVDLARDLILQHSVENSCQPCGDVITADLNSEADVERLLREVSNHSSVIDDGGLFGIINNASIYNQIPFEQLTIEDIRLNFRIHLEVPFILARGLFDLLKAKQGCIVGIIDTSQGRSWKDLSHYTSSKSALKQLMVNLAGDLQPDIRVNCVAPGAIISADWEVEHFASILEIVPIGRSGEPLDIANAVKFLLESPHISGQTINVDGGWTLVE